VDITKPYVPKVPANENDPYSYEDYLKMSGPERRRYLEKYHS